MTLSLSVIDKIRKSTSIWSKSILYIDRGVIVLNKPPGLVCQGSRNPSQGNIFNLQGFSDGLRTELNLNCAPYPVHRLDKGTTGSLVLARSASFARELSQQFQGKIIEKTYLALVRGGEKSFPSKSGKIRAPLQYIDGRASLDPHGVLGSSSTDWELVSSSPVAPLSLVRLKLLTGHKHQLRVHMAQCLQAPILGDTLHSRKATSEAITRLAEVPRDRIFLHASELSLLRYKTSGPSKRFRLGIRAPLPKDFLEICTDLGIRIDQEAAEKGLSVDGLSVKDGILPDLDGYLV